MERSSDRFDLAAELRALRPEPEAQFTDYLDTRVTAGFPRPGVLGELIDRVRLIPPRRALATAGACALAAIAVATGAIVVSNGERPSRLNVATSTPPPRHAGHPHVQFSAPVAPAAGPSAASAEESAGAGSSTGPYASHAHHRDVERAASIVLGADPVDVHRDAAKVFETVHAASGIVMRSSIRDGGAGEAGASFDLLIPSGRLGDALASLSAIGEVRSRHESAEDVTAPTIGLGERLQDSRAKVESLLAQLAGATSDAERAEVEAELSRERDRAAALRSRLNTLHRRATFSRVSVRIETGEEGSSGGGAAGWGLDDGLHAAGRVLAVAAGVTVVGLATLVPLALALLLATLAYRAWLRRAREQALS